MTLPNPFRAPYAQGAAFGLSWRWRYRAVAALAVLALPVIVAQLIFGFSPAGMALIIAITAADLILAVSLLPSSNQR